MVARKEDRKRVLVVEDNEEQLEVLRLLLTSAGFEVSTETNADRVFAAVSTLRPALVVLDVMLPGSKGLDGLRLCQMIRDDPALCGTKVIIVSAIAHGAADLREDIRREVDADDYIVKPYDPARLLQRVTEILGS